MENNKNNIEYLNILKDSLIVNEEKDKAINEYFADLEKKRKKTNIKLIEETKIKDFIDILNKDFLPKLDIKLGFEEGIVFNIKTGDTIIELLK